MNKLKNALRRNREAMTTRTAKIGGYSFLLSLLVLAILIAVNVAVSNLPATLTQFDISARQLYSVTSATKAEVQNLNDDVTIYWITQAGEEDSVIEKLLNVYDSLSDKITVEKKDPDVYPTFAAQYTDEDVANNSLIVVSGDRSRYIAYADIYLTDTSEYYTTGSVSYSFDGESCITTAIDYVTTEDLPLVYVVTGHGEPDMSDTFTSALEKQNIETAELNLLTSDSVPEDADAVLIYAPTQDYSEEEVDLLRTYLDNGGKLMVLSGPQQDVTLDNLNGLLTDCGITVADGIVIEGDRDHYTFNAPYLLLADLGDSTITEEMAENNSNIVVPIAGGMMVGDTPTGITVTQLLTTSDSSFAKAAGYNLTTYDKEDGDTDGPFAVAVDVADVEAGSDMIWISSDAMMDDDYVSYSSNANTDFVMNALSSLIGETDSISIRSRSLDYSYLTISTSQSTILKVFMIGLIPAFCIGCGAEDVLRRRKKA